MTASRPGAPRPRRAGSTSLATPLSQLAVVLAFLGAWQVAAQRGPFGSSLPGPASTAAALGDLLGTGVFWRAVGGTLAGAGLGLGIALAVAVPAGLVIGSTRLAFLSTRLVIDVLRTVPPIALVPLLLLLHGSTARTTVTIVVFGTVWLLLLQVVYAVREVDPVARDMARAYRLDARTRFTTLLLPSSMPFLMTGIRVAATIALLLAVGTELIANAPGIGYQMFLAQTNGLSAQLYAYVVVTALIGLAVNAVLLAARRRLLFWHGDVRGGTR